MMTHIINTKNDIMCPIEKFIVWLIIVQKMYI